MGQIESELSLRSCRMLIDASLRTQVPGRLCHGRFGWFLFALGLIVSAGSAAWFAWITAFDSTTNDSGAGFLFAAVFWGGVIVSAKLIRNRGFHIDYPGYAQVLQCLSFHAWSCSVPSSMSEISTHKLPVPRFPFGLLLLRLVFCGPLTRDICSEIS